MWTRYEISAGYSSGNCFSGIAFAVLFDQVCDGLAELFCQGFGLARGVAGGGDGFAEDEFDGGAIGGGIEVPGVDGEQVVDADQGDGDERDLGADGEVGGSVEKGPDFAGGGAGAFREDEDAEALAEGSDTGGEAGQGGAGVGGVDGKLAGAVEIPADEGEGPELFFSEDAELEGQAGEDYRGVHVGGVVGGEDGCVGYGMG